MCRRGSAGEGAGPGKEAEARAGDAPGFLQGSLWGPEHLALPKPPAAGVVDAAVKSIVVEVLCCAVLRELRMMRTYEGGCRAWLGMRGVTA